MNYGYININTSHGSNININKIIVGINEIDSIRDFLL